MVRNFNNSRINQLPFALSGIFYKVMTNGIRLSFKALKYPFTLQNCEMPLLP
ncbi:hypothetical protein JCM16418A_28460 [Paenibacillus pini]